MVRDYVDEKEMEECVRQREMLHRSQASGVSMVTLKSKTHQCRHEEKRRASVEMELEKEVSAEGSSPRPF